MNTFSIGCRCLICQSQKVLGSFFFRYNLMFCFSHLKLHCDHAPCFQSIWFFVVLVVFWAFLERVVFH